MVICTYENRPEAMIGLKLLILSIRRFCPDLTIVISCPDDILEFKQWLGNQKHVVLRYDSDLASHGWDAKPSLILRLLDEGYQEVIWLDSDIILDGDIRIFWQNSDERELIVSEAWCWDRYQGGTIRTTLWGMDAGRSLPSTVSSGLLRATTIHRKLLLAWQRLLDEPCYKDAQHIQPMSVRPVHLQGDQDVLTALLAAKSFSEIPLRYVKRGRDIAQCVGPAGFSAWERLACLGGHRPILYHGAEPKIWDVSRRASILVNPREYYQQLTFDLSPYAYAAQQYCDQLDEQPQALINKTILAQLCGLITGNHVTLQGLPLALLHGLGKQLKYYTGLTRTPHQNTFDTTSRVVNGQDILDRLNS